MANEPFGRQVLEFMDRVYNTGAESDALGVVPPFFESLRHVLDFSTAIFLRIDPGTWLLEEGHSHDLDPLLMHEYLRHYKRLDPLVIYSPCLMSPNEVVRFSDVADVSRLSHGEFGEFMQRVPYLHALALTPFVRGMPLGVFSIQRRRQAHDFDDAEQELFRRFVWHAAAAMDYRRLIARLNRADHPAAMVVSHQGRILAASDQARVLLEMLPDDKVFSLPSTVDRPRVWVVGSGAHVVRSVVPARDSLLEKLDSTNVAWCSDIGALERKIRVVPNQDPGHFVVSIEPLEAGGESNGKLVGFGFTERQEEVAVHLILGRKPKVIAGACNISVNTVNEHIEQIYRKLNVRSREDFLREVLGPSAADKPV